VPHSYDRSASFISRRYGTEYLSVLHFIGSPHLWFWNQLIPTPASGWAAANCANAGSRRALDSTDLSSGTVPYCTTTGTNFVDHAAMLLVVVLPKEQNAMSQQEDHDDPEQQQQQHAPTHVGLGRIIIPYVVAAAAVLAHIRFWIVPQIVVVHFLLRVC
jgi:predicted secreted protein